MRAATTGLLSSSLWFGFGVEIVGRSNVIIDATSRITSISVEQGNACSMNDEGEWTGTAHFRITLWALGNYRLSYAFHPFGAPVRRKFTDNVVVRLHCNINLYETLNSLVKGTAWSRFREKQLSNRTRELLGIKDTFSEKDVLIDLSGESGVHPWAREIMTRGLATSLYYMEKPIWGILADQPGAREWTLPDSFPKVISRAAWPAERSCAVADGGAHTADALRKKCYICKHM